MDPGQAGFRQWHLVARDGDKAIALAQLPGIGHQGQTPCLVVDRGTGWAMLLGDDDLKACDGDVTRFVAAVDARLVAAP